MFPIRVFVMKWLLERLFNVDVAIHLGAILDFFGIIIVSLLIGFILRSLFHRLAKKTDTRFDDILYEVIGAYAGVWLLIWGTYWIVGEFPFLSATNIDQVRSILKTIFAVSIVISIAKALTMWMKMLASKSSSFRTIEKPIRFMIRVLIFVIGLILVLDVMDISITPLVTTLGLGSLAVALALQDTFANFFAGLYLAADRPIRVGDFVRINEDEGFVEELGWRSTKIRTFQNSLVIYPNSVVSQSMIVNYYLPSNITSLVIPIGVSYSSDTRKVESIIMEEIKKISGELEWFDSATKPEVYFKGYGAYSLDFDVIFWLRDFSKYRQARNEFLHRLFKRFAEEGIHIPFPIRTIYSHQVESGGV